LTSISAEKNSTIIFPVPIDLLRAFVDRKWSVNNARTQDARMHILFEQAKKTYHYYLHLNDNFECYFL
jgi:hypothetical protein